MTPARCRKVKARAQSRASGMKARTEAPVNGGRNYNGPKVNDRAALVKAGYMLESLRMPRYTTQPLTKLTEASRENTTAADNQQERPNWKRFGILRDYTPVSGESWRRYSPDCMATCRGRQKCSSHFTQNTRGVVTASSEIPCRVSSDLHEWWNDRATVLASGSANLWFR